MSIRVDLFWTCIRRVTRKHFGGVQHFLALSGLHRKDIAAKLNLCFGSITGIMRRLVEYFGGR